MRPSSAVAISCLVPLAAVVAPAAAAPPVRCLLLRSVAPAPAGADGVRVRLFSDKSGGTVQVRLVAPTQDGVLAGYFAAPPIVLDFDGWKTVTLPLSSFVFGSDINPDAIQDGLARRETLTASTSLELAVTGSNVRIAVNELAWATGENSAAAMETFDAASIKQWKTVGDYDQIRAIRFGSVAAGELSEGGKPSLQIIVRNHALNERQINKPSVDTRLKKNAQVPYAIYVRDPFDPICAESVPSVQEIAAPATLNLLACADEIEPASFSVYSIREIKDATVRIVGGLTADTGKSLPGSSVDVRVVRVGSGYPAPQLLMKDDRQPLTDPIPAVRLSGEPTTDIPAETSKQFWITVRVPANTTPGVYRGKLVFTGSGVKPTTVPLNVTVPDITLKTAFLQYGIELRSHAVAPGENVGGEAVAQETFSEQLKNIKDHGFRLVQIFEEVGSLENDIRLYRDANLSLVGPVVVAVRSGEEAATVESMKRSIGLSSGFDFYYFLTPEMVRGGGVGDFGRAVTNANRNALVAAVVESSEVYGTLRDALNDPAGERLAPIYPISSDYAQKVLAEGKRSTPNRDYWRWSIPDQSPARNRLFSGFLLYRTGPGFYGAFPGPYQRVPEGMSPFAAFGTTEANAPRPAMTTFPVQGGVLDTIQWEAAREGVDDIRYIGALKANIRELKDAKKAKDATDAAEASLASLMDRALITLSPAQHHAARLAILDQALQLKYILNPAARRSAAPKTPTKTPKAPARPKKKT
ncbi:MAG: hypothetical protein SFU56_02865 [Capsulimonadales bacterium]|nr:hypothetical protein [Capsulimonadales bacterium]